MAIPHYLPKRMYDGETELERQDRKKAIREENERLLAEFKAKGGEIKRCSVPKFSIEHSTKVNRWRQYPKKSEGGND